MKELNGQKLQCSVRWARGAASTAPKTRTQPEVSDNFSGLRLPICEKFLCQGPDDADGAQVDEGRDDVCGWCSGCLRCSRASGAVRFNFELPQNCTYTLYFVCILLCGLVCFLLVYRCPSHAMRFYPLQCSRHGFFDLSVYWKGPDGRLLGL